MVEPRSPPVHTVSLVQLCNTRVTNPAMALTQVTTSCVCIPFYWSSCANNRVTSPAMALTRVTTSCVCIPFYRSSCANHQSSNGINPGHNQLCLHTILLVQLCQHPSHQSSNDIIPGHNQLCLHTILPVQLYRHIKSPIMAVPQSPPPVVSEHPPSCASAHATLPLAQLTCSQNHRVLSVQCTPFHGSNGACIVTSIPINLLPDCHRKSLCG